MAASANDASIKHGWVFPYLVHSLSLNVISADDPGGTGLACDGLDNMNMRIT